MAMNLDLTKPRFVFLGAWNRAILNPQWIARHLLGYPEGATVQAGIFINSSSPKEQTIFIDEVGILASSDRVSIFNASMDERVVARAEAVCLALFRTLPHTPMGAWGVNFNFALSDPDDDLLDQLTANDRLTESYAVIGQTLGAAIRRDDGGVLNLSRTASPTNVVFDFNYHFETPLTVADAERRLLGATRSFLTESQALLRTVYGLEMAGIAGFNIPVEGEGRQANGLQTS
jgi:hypothetical protein